MLFDKQAIEHSALRWLCNSWRSKMYVSQL